VSIGNLEKGVKMSKPRIFFGCNRLGRQYKVEKEQLVLMIEAGCRGFEIADFGNRGQETALRVVGDAIIESGVPREEFHISLRSRLRNVLVRELFEEALKDLQMDYVDTYVCQVESAEADYEYCQPWIEGTGKLIDEGKIKRNGVFAYNPRSYKNWIDYNLTTQWEHAPQVMLVKNNALHRYPELLHIQLGLGNSMEIMTVTPFGAGASCLKEDAPGFFSPFGCLERAQPIADEIGCTVPQLMLAFPGLLFDDSSVAVSTGSVPHWIENQAAVEVREKIDIDIFDKLVEAFPVNLAYNPNIKYFITEEEIKEKEENVNNNIRFTVLI
jgi:diketogulonate reductase-like aldo/keto reductase